VIANSLRDEFYVTNWKNALYPQISVCKSLSVRNHFLSKHTHTDTLYFPYSIITQQALLFVNMNVNSKLSTKTQTPRSKLAKIQIGLFQVPILQLIFLKSWTVMENVGAFIWCPLAIQWRCFPQGYFHLSCVSEFPNCQIRSLGKYISLFISIPYAHKLCCCSIIQNWFSNKQELISFLPLELHWALRSVLHVEMSNDKHLVTQPHNNIQRKQ